MSTVLVAGSYNYIAIYVVALVLSQSESITMPSCLTQTHRYSKRPLTSQYKTNQRSVQEV